MNDQIPVIAIDGPSASGKGTVATRVAEALGWRFLDSGAIYRLLAVAALQKGIDLADEQALADEGLALDAEFSGEVVRLDGRDVSVDIRTETAGNVASKIAALPAVRAALLARQRAFRAAPGLVADGRDMGSVVFPEAVCKVFLTASARVRAERRYKQLIAKGLTANIEILHQELLERDARDSARSVAPLKPCEDAVVLDTSLLGIGEAVQFVLDLARQRGVRSPD